VPRARRWRWLAGALIAVVLALGAVAASCSPARVIEAARVMQDVAAGEGPRPLKAATPAPRRASIGYRIDGRIHEGDLYTTAAPEGPRGAVVLVPGVAPRGRDDPRLVAFATTLARARFLVLAPEIPGLRALRVAPGDAEAIGDAVRHLNERAGAAAGGVGLVAFSYAAGPAVVAALDTAIGARLDFVLLVGGYHSVEALATFVTTGGYRPSPAEAWQGRTPNPRGKWLFLLSNAERVDDPADRALLREIGTLKLDDPEAPIEPLVARLGPEGRAIEALLRNAEPDRVPELLAAMPAAIRADMAALDLARRDLSALAPRLYLVHGRDDAVIPYTESEALGRAAREAVVFVVDSLAHVELGPGDVFDVLALWRAAYLLLEERDAD
jgi:pimeloyl-ACP methyl ester carboxylesterase